MKYNTDLLYIHCKSGIGRAVIVVACLLCIYHNIRPRHALFLTNKYFYKRPSVKDKLPSFKCPRSYLQKNFIYHYFTNLYFSDYKINYFSELNLKSDHYIILNDEFFPSAFEAFYFFKNKYRKNEILIQMMHLILKIKFKLHPELKKKLLLTGMKTLKFHHEMKYVGVELEKIRYSLFLNKFF